MYFIVDTKDQTVLDILKDGVRYYVRRILPHLYFICCARCRASEWLLIHSSLDYTSIINLCNPVSICSIVTYCIDWIGRACVVVDEVCLIAVCINLIYIITIVHQHACSIVPLDRTNSLPRATIRLQVFCSDMPWGRVFKKSYLSLSPYVKTLRLVESVVPVLISSCRVIEVNT